MAFLPALAGFAVVSAGFALVMGGLAWSASRVRRRRGGGESLMGPFEEIWHPAAYRARLEIQVHDERPAPSPLPGDGKHIVALPISPPSPRPSTRR